MGALLAIAAIATAASGDPAPAPRPTATAVARATILSPVTLRIGDGEAAKLVSSDTTLAPPRPRIAERACDATPESKRCPAIVFDMP